jgi:hypothetical protein
MAMTITKHASAALLALGLGIGGLIAGAAAPAAAHHAFSMYDNTVYKKVTGTVKTYLWSNPHTMIDFTAPGADGKMQPWTAECSPINMIGRRGWTEESLKPGDKVDIVLHPNRNGANYGLLVSATKTDGTVLKDKD